MDDASLYRSWDDIALARQECPFARRDELDAYDAVRHETVVSILRDPTLFSNRQITMFPLDPSIASLDPPEHTAVRRSMLGAFTPRAIAELEPAIRRDADRLVDELPAPGDVFEIKLGYAVPLALLTIMHLLRLPRDDQALLRAGTEAVEALAAGLERTRERTGAVRAVDEYFTAVADERIAAAEAGTLERDPRDPVAALVFAHLDGIIDRRMVARNTTTLFHGGNGTTTTALSNGIAAIDAFPDQKALFLADPQRYATGFVEETLRFEGSTHGLFRTATADVSIEGTALHQGDRVFCRYGAASRDPAVFPDPDHFDITRDWSELPQHLGFGIGAHHCIGAPLARTQMGIALTALYSRLPGFRVVGSPDDRRLTGLIFRGYERLHVTYDERLPSAAE